MQQTSAATTPVEGERDYLAEWREPLRWGFGAAVAHRVFYAVWLALIWLLIGNGTFEPLAASHEKDLSDLPVVTDTTLGEATLGVWRRFDAIHYLNLAEHGYRVFDEQPSFYGPVTPAAFWLFNKLLPGPVDVGAMVFQTLAFGIALTLLYRVVIAYYGGSRQLAEWSVVITASLPLAYYFAAPMSEAAYLAFVLGAFFIAARLKKPWLLVGILGALATLTRNQGVVLAAPLGLLILVSDDLKDIPWFPDRIKTIIWRGLPLLLIPAAFLGFVWFRKLVGFPSIVTVSEEYFGHYRVDPFTGLVTNLRWFVVNPHGAVSSADIIFVPVYVALMIATLLEKRNRKLPFAAYNLLFMILYLTNLNDYTSNRSVAYTSSFARYTLTLFPITIMIADWLRHSPRWARLLVTTLAMFIALYISGRFAVGGGPH